MKQSGNKTQFAILGALSLESMSGYEIKKMMAESTNYFWSESNGQIYPTLANLVKEKLVTLEEQPVGEKSRNIYTLTKMGKKKLQQWLTAAVEYYPHRNELLLKLFYGQHVAPKISVNHIENHRQKCQAALNLYQGIEKTLAKMVEQKTSPIYFLLTVKAGVKHAQAELEWCDEAIHLIGATNHATE